MWDKIKNTDSRVYMLFAIIILLIILLQQCDSRQKAEHDLAMANNNILALNDTITKTQNRLSQEQYEKRSFITSLSGLKDINRELYDEVKAQKGRVAQLTKIVGVLATPKPVEPIGGVTTVTGTPCDSLGGTFATEWESRQQFDTVNSRILKARTEISLRDKKVESSQTNILQDEISFDLVTGLEKKDDGYKIFIRSNYPGFSPKKITGAFIPQSDLLPPQPRKNWSLGIGPQTGLGVRVIPTPMPVWYIGIGLNLQFNLINF
jgi:hypothetical protein